MSAFARNDREAYFGAPGFEASFVLYTLEQPLLSRDTYQVLWDGWRAEASRLIQPIKRTTCGSGGAMIRLARDGR